MKHIFKHLAHFALLIAGVWVLAFAVLPHHHDAQTGMPCLDLHHAHAHNEKHDDCALTKSFIVEFQREDDLFHLVSQQAGLLSAMHQPIPSADEVILDIQDKPYAYALQEAEVVCHTDGRAPPRA